MVRTLVFCFLAALFSTIASSSLAENSDLRGDTELRAFLCDSEFENEGAGGSVGLHAVRNQDEIHHHCTWVVLVGSKYTEQYGGVAESERIVVDKYLMKDTCSIFITESAKMLYALAQSKYQGMKVIELACRPAGEAHT